MPPSVAEIITFPVSEAYRADSSTTAADLVGVLHKAPRPTRIYHGPQVEDPSQGYLVTVWETYDQTRATLASSLHFDVHHVQFAADPTSALSAPVVELVFFTLKEGKTKSEIAPHLDTLVSQDTKTVISSMWGHSIRRDNQLVMLVGWESLEASAKSDLVRE
ncbi:hypothetical protein DFH11DRAFT_1127839 [Phellopilus nigrolimitatus]|nr:hypothetical protein DFH11DRAFT_1127839 [Phellopilus nigrolimitatus]